jgi:hypothetical protein
MGEKKKFLLRLDEALHSALEKWAADDLRSVNAQMEFLLTDAVKKAGRTITKVSSENKEETSA